MAKVLINFSDDWSDEMDIYGWAIVDKDVWETAEIRLMQDTEGFELWFGTNESNEYDTGEDFLEALWITEISDEEAATLENLFKNTKYGNTSFLNKIIK